MEQNTRHNRKHLQRNITRPEEKEEHSQIRPKQTNTTTKEAKHQRRFKRTITLIINFSKYQLTPGETSLLSKGLNFISTPKKNTQQNYYRTYYCLIEDLRLKYFFHHNNYTQPTEQNNTTLYPSSGWTPPSGQEPFLESYRSTIIHNTLKEIKKNNKRQFKRNLKQEELTAITTLLRNNKDIVIELADKGGNIVIMNSYDYIKEGLRQLSDHNHFELLEEDPTQNYNNQIYQVLQQAVNLGIIDEKMKKTLYNKTPRIPNFYMLPKIHKTGNPGRPIVNGIGSITKKISAYIDEEIRQLIPRIPSYLKDTTHLINIPHDKKLASADILVTIDVKSLYTNIPHTEGIKALNRTMEETDTNSMKKLLICRLANLVLTKNYFEFNNKLYRQTQGTAMGTRMAY